MPSLKTLTPALRRPAEQLFALGRQYDRTLMVTSARRTYAEQARLFANYKAGKSALPALPPGRSMHQVGRAFDMARPTVDPYKDDLLAALGKIWTGWGGRWYPSDPVHFEG